MIHGKAKILWTLLATLLLTPLTLAESPVYSGLSLAEALKLLENDGLRLIYSTFLVRPEMRVENEPQSTEPRDILDEILAPHGLEAVPARRGRLVVRPVATPPPESSQESASTPPELPNFTAHDEIDVSSSYRLYVREPAPPVSLSREQISKLPHFGDDPYRTITLLPGVSGAELTARFALRGGLHSEILVRLDGLELTEPFHVKDAQGLFSIIDPDLVDGIDLIAGAYPAEYGDRMSGVVDISTGTVQEGEARLGLSLLNLWGGGSDTFANGRGSWTLSGRRGFLDIFEDPPDNPQEGEGETLTYWDVFGRVEVSPQPTSTLAFRLLVARDIIDILINEPRDISEAETDWRNDYLWISHRRIFGARLILDSVLDIGHLGRDRTIASNEIHEIALVRDQRSLDRWGLRQDWSFAPSGQHLFAWGVDLRRYDGDYDYRNDRTIDSAITVVRHLPPNGTTVFNDSFAGNSSALYFSDRWQAGRLVVNAGGRWDRQTLNEEDQFSPRLNMVLDLVNGGALRFGWGYFYQSQRPHELDVQDGETVFQGAERSTHWALGWQRDLPRDFHLRIDAYRRNIQNVRPRFENLFDPFSPLPEVQSDRVRIAPQSSHSEGVELFLVRKGARRWNGWLSYVLSDVYDRVDGRRQARYLNQRHALTLSVGFQLSKSWHLSLVGRYHSGWPTTAVNGDFDVNGEPVVVVGPYYEESHPDFQRIDIRATRSRTIRKGKGTFSFYIDVQNLTNRQNVRGFEIRNDRFRLGPDGSLQVRPSVEHWPGLVPNFGVRWNF